ncbi:MAG: Fur family transcriptional regulator [Thermaerobacter sp.]|nr:Fur family transcriptional regulator [Thermaerobacter sp.]
MTKSGQHPSPFPTAEQLLRSHHMRVTPQRRLVLSWFLAHPGEHWTAEQVRERLLTQLPELARGTTYKVLNEFVRLGMLEEIPSRDDSLRYGLRLDPHHHFFCETCQRWYDIKPQGLAQLQLNGDDRDRFCVTDVLVTFRGVCQHCQDPSIRL